VVQALSEGRIEVHGWYYDILTGSIERYDLSSRRFAPLLADRSDTALSPGAEDGKTRTVVA
jgi:carbonic anhydrase